MMTTAEWFTTIQHGTQVYPSPLPDATMLTVIAYTRRADQSGVPTVVAAEVDARGGIGMPFYYSGDSLARVAEATQIQKAARAELATKAGI